VIVEVDVRSEGMQWGPYVLERALGEGSVSRVFRARNRDDGTVRAIKLLKDDAPLLVERALQEARVLAGLSHPNVASVHDVLSGPDGLGLVMDYADGGCLADLLALGPLTLPQVDHLVLGVLRGLQAVHAHRLVHRDLKPANILLAVEGDTLVPRLADFGLAKVPGTSRHHGPRTFTGVTLGSPAYMAPEQVEDAGSVTPATDVFACGAMFFELVTGRRAYGAPDAMRCYRDMLHENRPALPVGTPRRVRRAIEAALRPDPADRPQTADALLRCWFDESTSPGPVQFPEHVRIRLLRAGHGVPTLEPVQDRAGLPPVVVPLAVAGALGALGLGAFSGALLLIGLALNL
jgi:serine/threonine-protein kinase